MLAACCCQPAVHPACHVKAVGAGDIFTPDHPPKQVLADLDFTPSLRLRSLITGFGMSVQHT